MNRTLKDLREDVLKNRPDVKPKLVNRSGKKQLCEMLGLPSEKKNKYRLVNQITGVTSDWYSMYQIQKVYDIRESNFFWYMRTRKTMMIDGVPYKVLDLDEVEEFESVESAENKNIVEDEKELSDIEEEPDDESTIRVYCGDVDELHDRIIYGRMPAPWSNDEDLVRYDNNGDIIGMRD